MGWTIGGVERAEGCEHGFPLLHYGRLGDEENRRQFQKVSKRPLWNHCREAAIFMSD